MLEGALVRFIAGKGGVGRTTVVAAAARAAAARGRNVLAMEFADPADDQSALARAFGARTLGEDPVRVAPGVWALRLSAPAGQAQFLASVLPSKRLAHAAAHSRLLQRFFDAAPGVHDLGQLNHMARWIADDRFEDIFVDLPATGHALGLAALPESVARLVPSGPLADAVRRGMAWARDPARTAVWIVTLPGSLPVTEALEMMRGLEAHGLPVGGVVLNRSPDDPFDAGSRAAASGLLTDAPMAGARTFRRLEAAHRDRERLAATGKPVIVLPDEPDPDRLLAALQGGGR